MDANSLVRHASGDPMMPTTACRGTSLRRVTDGPQPDGRLLHALGVTADQIPQGFLVFDERGSVCLANQRAGAIFGDTAESLVGATFERLFPSGLSSDHIDRWTWFRSALRHHDTTASRRMDAARRDGTAVRIEIGLSAADDGDSRYVVASVVDVSEQFELETRLAAVTAEHLAFQRHVGDLATRFAAVAPSALDELIVASLGEIAQALTFDLGMLWQWTIGEGNAVPTHSWTGSPREVAPALFPVAALPHVVSNVRAHQAVWFSSLDDLPHPIDRDTFRQRGIRSGVVLPMKPPGEESSFYGLAFMSMTEEHDWEPAVVDRLHLVKAVIKQALAHRRSQTALQSALEELQRLRTRPGDIAVERRRDVKLAGTSRLIIAESSTVRRAVAQIEQVAPTSATVLLLGETGAGKEVFAQTVHDLSPRHRRPMVVVNCAAIPTTLIESELFGRERGAYTGALSRQIGRFEAANQSTLFLDEIGELPADMQVKLLRVLEDHTIERLGSPQPIKIDVRIIAATHRDLEKAVREGSFRQDLFYRLNVFPVTVPPLRERIDDVPGLVWTFVDEFARAFGKTIDSISRDSMEELQRYPWPGNVRELRNVVERAVILATGRQLVVPLPAATTTTVPQSAMTLATLEVEHIRSVLESTNWRVRGHGGAAERLGLKPTTLESRMARFGILRPAVPA